MWNSQSCVNRRNTNFLRSADSRGFWKKINPHQGKRCLILNTPRETSCHTRWNLPPCLRNASHLSGKARKPWVPGALQLLCRSCSNWGVEKGHQQPFDTRGLWNLQDTGREKVESWSLTDLVRKGDGWGTGWGKGLGRLRGFKDRAAQRERRERFARKEFSLYYITEYSRCCF